MRGVSEHARQAMVRLAAAELMLRAHSCLQSKRLVEKPMRWGFVSIPAFVLACATSSPNQQMTATGKAQRDAQQQYQVAANAQKHAAEEQQKAEQAQREVTKAQKNLADAQAKLEGQRAKSAQAQQEAGVMGRDAQLRGTQAQEQATQKQGEEARQGKLTEQDHQRAWMQT